MDIKRFLYQPYPYPDQLLKTALLIGIVFIVFGSIGLKMVRSDFNNFRRRSAAANTWLLVHIQRMIAGYIAALTAFMVVNNQILPPVVAWLCQPLYFFH